MDIEQMLRFENEYTQLDFKKSQYRKEQSDNLIKDLIAMANANVKGPRYIIIGVKYFPDGNREYHPINPGDFVDEAEYQQLIRENVEPSLPFRYLSLRLEEGVFGYFVIDDPLDPPYLLKKDRRTLKTGDGWIRVGSSQNRLTRSDLDIIYNRKSSELSKEGFSTPTNSIFEQELRWASSANSNGTYFSVILDYGQEYGELTSSKRRELLEWAKKAAHEMGIEVHDAYTNSTTDLVEFWAPHNQSDFHMKYHHPGVVWLQFRNEEETILLEWLVMKYMQAKHLLQQVPHLKNLKEKQLAIALVNWPQFGIDLNPYVVDYDSLRQGHLRGVSLVERTSIDDEPNWEQFFKTTLERGLTESGYIGHGDGILALQLNL